MPGPNDRHFSTDEKTGQRVMLPGLGPDEPDEKKRSQMEREAAVARARREELADLERKIRGQAADHEERERIMKAREAELEERERQADIEIEERLSQLAERSGATTEESLDAGGDTGASQGPAS